jgi:hypothetical protein
VRAYDKVAILSAKCGLLYPFEEIEPYDMMLNNMSVDQVKKWSDQVFQQLLVKIELHNLDKVYFHAGKRERAQLEKMDIKCEVPLKNLGFGEKLAWYIEHDL